MAVLYIFDLGDAPVYLGGDEAQFAVGGHALATTGRNVNGDVLPLFFNLADPHGDPRAMPWGDTWYHPFLFYLIALALKVLPFSESTVRLPAALIGGVVTPLLTYAVARRLRLERPAAFVAAVMIALAPANVILSRQALDYVLPLPFALGWLWFLSDYIQTHRLRSALMVGLLLGVGCYTYIASWAMMPLLLAVSWFAFWRAGGAVVRPVLASAVAFAPAMLLLGSWLWTHPHVIRETVARYQVLDSHRSPAPDGASRIASVRTAVPVYASYFDPVFLFRRGGDSMTASTGRMGAFLVPVIVLLPVGFVTLLRRGNADRMTMVLVAGLLLAPVPAAISGQSRMIQRALLLLPFGVLISAYGFSVLWHSRRRVIQLGALALLALVPLQFAVFYRDFHTHYKLRSAFYYDSVAFAGVAQYLMDDAAAPSIYLRRDLDAVGAKWRFYVTKGGRRELLERTTYVSDRRDLEGAPAGSLLVMYVENGEIEALERTGHWKLEKIVADVDNREAAAILRNVS